MKYARTIAAAAATAIALGGVSVAQADAAKKKNKNPEVTLLRMGDEGTNEAKLDGKKVWNVRKGYNKIKVELVGISRASGSYYDAAMNEIPVTNHEYKFRTSGTVQLECLRKKGDAWYESVDRRRTVITNRTRTLPLPVKNPYRCRVTVDVSQYSTYAPDSEFPGASLTTVKNDYTLLKATVKSVKK